MQLCTFLSNHSSPSSTLPHFRFHVQPRTLSNPHTKQFKNVPYFKCETGAVPNIVNQKVDIFSIWLFPPRLYLCVENWLRSRLLNFFPFIIGKMIGCYHEAFYANHFLFSVCQSLLPMSNQLRWYFVNTFAQSPTSPQ